MEFGIEARKLNMDIIAIQEIRWPDNGILQISLCCIMEIRTGMSSIQHLVVNKYKNVILEFQ